MPDLEGLKYTGIDMMLTNLHTGGETMNKTELIAAVAELSELSKKDAESAVTATFDAITEALRRDEKETLEQYRERKARERRSSAGMLLAGLVYLILSLVALLLYYTVSI